MNVRVENIEPLTSALRHAFRDGGCGQRWRRTPFGGRNRHGHRHISRGSRRVDAELAPSRSSLARGALLAMGCMAPERQGGEIGPEEGSVAGLVRLANVLTAPILAYGLGVAS